VEEVLHDNQLHRQSAWTESIAVGSKEFVIETKKNLANRAIGRDVVSNKDVYERREPSVSYCTHFDAKNDALRLENTCFGNSINATSKI